MPRPLSATSPTNMSALASRVARRCAALALGTLVGLALGEGLVRAAGAGGTTLSRGRLNGYDADAGWTCLPNLDAYYSLPGSFRVRVRCNSRGLRDSEKAVPKPAGTTRIVVLGDSFTWGYGVENDETFPAVLVRQLPAADAVNLGVNGYSTVQESIRLETEGLRYEPDWVVVAFCHNDLEDNFDEKDGGRPVAALGEDGLLRIENRPVRAPWKSPAKQWLRHSLRLWNLIEYDTDLRRLEARRLALAVADPAAPPPLDEDLQIGLAELYTLPSARIDLAWEVERLLLAQIQVRAASVGARVLVVGVAMQEAVDAERFARVVASQVDAALQPDWDRPGRRLRELCERSGIPCVDLAPVFRSQPDRDALFLRDNGHWSAAGQRLAALTIAQALAALIPARG